MPVQPLLEEGNTSSKFSDSVTIIVVLHNVYRYSLFIMCSFHKHWPENILATTLNDQTQTPVLTHSAIVTINDK